MTIADAPVASLPVASDIIQSQSQSTDIIGRWGPDETKEERKRRQEAGLIFQHEELPTRSDFPPDPVPQPPHEPQRWEDAPAEEPVAEPVKQRAAPKDVAYLITRELAREEDERAAEEWESLWDDPQVLSALEQFAKRPWWFK